MPRPINRRGTGSIFKDCEHADWSRCKHEWRIRFRNASGRQEEESGYPNATKAWDRLDEIKEAKRSGTLPATARRDTLFGAYCDTWLSRRRALQDSSATQYEIAVRLHVKPAIGEAKKLHTVGRQTLFDFVETLEASGMSGRYVRHIWSNVLMPIIRSATADNLLTPINIRDIELPGIVKKEIYVPTRLEVATLEQEIGFSITLMAGCGLRIGEALGINERCFYDKDEILRINEQWRKAGSLGPLKHRRAGQYRDVPLPSYVVERRAERLEDVEPVEGYLFPSPRKAGSLIAHASLQERIARVVGTKKLDTRITAHTLRHFYVAHNLSEGVDITAVARFLGHQNIQLTYGTYGHLLRPTFGLAGQAMDRVLRSK